MQPALVWYAGGAASYTQAHVFKYVPCNVPSRQQRYIRLVK